MKSCRPLPYRFHPLGIVTVTTAGNGYYALTAERADRGLQLSDLLAHPAAAQSRTVSLDLEAGLEEYDNKSGVNFHSWLHGHFDPEDWDIGPDGERLLYPDTAVPIAIEDHLRCFGYQVQRGDVEWSEAGAQSETATDFEISDRLQSQFWPECDEPALRRQFPMLEQAWNTYKTFVAMLRDQKDD
jgi:hypothetical protein